jgi:hypothetical protein
MVTEVQAGGVSIPDRQAHLCALYGRPAGCQLTFAPQRLKGILVVSVAENVADPGEQAGWPGVMALTLTFTPTHRESVSAIYQYNEGATCEEMQWNLTQPPCFSESCVVEREQDPTYVGPHEVDLLDQAFVNNLLYQQPDHDMSARLQAMAQSSGTPVVGALSAKVGVVSDGTGDSRATTYTKGVTMRFLTGAQ